MKTKLEEEPKQENCCTPVGQIKRYVDCKGCDRKPKQERVCNCGLKESEHNVRHPFIPRKETLEEAAKNYGKIRNELDYGQLYCNSVDSFKAGAKWQQENIIEELEMHILVNEHDWNRNPQAQFRDFIEQFKKK
jgi:hypothetical protein